MERALELDPGSVSVWNTLGKLYYDLGEDKRAAACFARLAELRLARRQPELARQAADNDYCDYSASVGKNLKKKRAKPAPKEERLKLDGDWQEAAKKAVRKKRPKKLPDK